MRWINSFVIIVSFKIISYKYKQIYYFFCIQITASSYLFIVILSICVYYILC